ncbi:MAG: SRPBCC family protein [Albidovulum sp.]
MKFSTREDIEAPAEVVFEALSDFTSFERTAVKRGVDVARSNPLAEVGVGLSWSLRFPVRGKMRRVMCEMIRFETPSSLGFKGHSNGYELELSLALVALSKARTRLGVEFEVKPRGLASRLMLQSIRLSKATYARRFEARVQKFASDLELKQIRRRQN